MSTGELVCDICGKGEFSTKASVAAHKRFIHHIPGDHAKPSPTEKVMEKLEEICEKLDGNKEVSMPSSEELDRVCEMFPDLCQKVDRIENLLESHPVPNETLLQMWRQCPECQPKFERLIKSGAFKEKAEEAKSDDFPWVDRSISD